MCRNWSWIFFCFFCVKCGGRWRHQCMQMSDSDNQCPVPTHINLLRSRFSYYWLGITHTVRSQILLLSSIGLSYLIGLCLLTGILNLGGGGGWPMTKIKLVKSSITKHYELFTSHYHMPPKYLVSPFTIFKNGPLTNYQEIKYLFISFLKIPVINLRLSRHVYM